MSPAPGAPSAPPAPRHPAVASAERAGPIVVLRGLWKTYGDGAYAVHALRDVSLAIRGGDLMAIMGASGSGKSTLMNVIGCLDLPDRGRYLLEGVDVRSLAESQLAEVRNRQIGFVFQHFNLIARTPAMENVELPLVYAGLGRRERRTRAVEALERVGLAGRERNQPSELSGGEQQRVAIARALVTDPTMLLADEPTGALDSETSHSVLRLFSDINAHGRTVVLITHEAQVAAYAKRIVRLQDGMVVGDERRAGLHDVPPGLQPGFSPSRRAA
jgi:putative ABC transport system ATP-binding protein